jgi:hypothetical protein
MTRNEAWKDWAKHEDKEAWRSRLKEPWLEEALQDLLANRLYGLATGVTGGDLLGNGPWTKDEVLTLWSLIFPEVGDRAKVLILTSLIESESLLLLDPQEVVEFLSDLHLSSWSNENSGKSPTSNAVMARRSIRAICTALVGPGGRPRVKRERPERRGLSEDILRYKEREARWVLSADKEAKRRKCALRDVIKERLDEAVRQRALYHERAQKARRASTNEQGKVDIGKLETHFAKERAARLRRQAQGEVPLPFGGNPYGFSLREILARGFKTIDEKGSPRIFAETETMHLATDLDIRYRTLIRKCKTPSKIHSALGLTKRRNKKRTRNPPAD